MLERGIDAEDLSVCFRMNQTGMPVAGVATDASAGSGVLLVQHASQRHVKRLEPQTGEVVAELLNTRLVTDRRMGIGHARRWIRRIFRTSAVHPIESLGLRVIRLELLV